MTTLNTNNIVVGDDGRISFSGLSSGIDSQAIINSTIAARRATAVKIESNIQANTDKIAAYAELKTLAEDFTGHLDSLRGSTSFFSDDVFTAKTGFFTSAAGAGAGAGYTPSDPANLLATSIASDAETGTHQITIQQTARAHQIRSGAFTSKTDDMTTLGVTAGTFELGTETITINGTDTLLDIRDKINASNAGVNATIVSATDTEHYLVLTSEETGLDFAMDLGTATQTSFDLGLTTANTGAAVISNELQTALNAILDVNGITNINRSSNEIDDIIEGVTLSIFQAEPDTDITLTIESDLNTIKTELIDFVESYNAIRDYYDDQRVAADRDLEVDSDGDGDPTNDEDFGSLAFDSTLRQMVNQMSSLVSQNFGSFTEGFQSLSQIGIQVNQDFKLEIDDEVLDNKLITNVEEVRKLFVTDYTTSDSRLLYAANTENTQSGTYYVNIAGTDVNGAITGGNISTTMGAGTGTDGSLVLSATSMTASSSSAAEGLRMLFNVGASEPAVTDIEVTISRGIADQLYYYFEDLTELQGTFDTLTDQLETRNADLEEQVDTIDARLETLRVSLEQKYTAMEVALIQLGNLETTIQGFIDAQNGDS